MTTRNQTGASQRNGSNRPGWLPVVLVLHAAILSGTLVRAHVPDVKNGPFAYDRPDQALEAGMLEQPESYDPSVAALGDDLWVAWLEFVPGQRDRLWIGKRQGDQWSLKQPVADTPAKLSHPTLTVDAADTLWLSYEAYRADAQPWDVFVCRVQADGACSPPQRVSPSQGNDIHHHVAADPSGGLWIVWQTDQAGQFDVTARHIGGPSNAESMAEKISDSPRGDWQPSVAVTADGKVCVVWDAYDGDSFNVLCRWRIDGRWAPISAVAAGPAFEARAQAIADPQGRVWVAWEDGGLNWGKAFRAKPDGWDNITDDHGPLHRFRKVRLAAVEPGGAVRQFADPLPMPALEDSARREGRWKGVEALGVYYEHPRLAIDTAGRLWIAYRHYWMPHVGVDVPVDHHIEEGWKVYARCLDGPRWSKFYAFDIPQRDGLQRVSIAGRGRGLALAWSTGRTDRRADNKPRGVAIGRVEVEGGQASQPKLLDAETPTIPQPSAVAARPAKASIGGRDYTLVYGDLHRHTDLSLCFVFFDGSVDDAYRYAIDVARLDFLGVTDHTRDIHHGDVLSQLWWRCTKEVTRHRLAETFFPYYCYERSHGDTDHNVISLRDDMLRNFPPPLPEFWKELDHDTFTIPHAPINARAWAFHDDAFRPLVEIYQGCRDYDSQRPVRAGLNKGYHLGFIASSDHLSTAASYACVWTPEVSREGIFRSMQARRTFGATDRIRLIFRSGDRWMGEIFTAEALPEFQIEIEGTAPLKELTIYDNGLPVASLPLEENQSRARTTYRPSEDFTGSHYLYLHLVQADGNQAWSSPIWVSYDNPRPSPESRFRAAAAGLKNLAMGKPVAISAPDEISRGNLELVTDGKLDSYLGRLGDGPAWVQIDLGEVQPLAYLRLWHYYQDGRSYRGNRVALSATGEFAGEEKVVYDSELQGEYVEQEEGKLLAFPPVAARYLRNWLTDNSSNRAVQWVEIEAYGPLGQEKK